MTEVKESLVPDAGKSSYVVLYEINGKLNEGFMTFIKYEGNEEALFHLNKQLDGIKHYHMYDDMSVFSMDLRNRVSSETATEICRVKINNYLANRKFNGKLDKLDLYLETDGNKRRIIKVFEKLGVGAIEQYATDLECNSDEELYDDYSEDFEYGSSSSDGSDSDSDDDNQFTKEPIKKH